MKESPDDEHHLIAKIAERGVSLLLRRILKSNSAVMS